MLFAQVWLVIILILWEGIRGTMIEANIAIIFFYFSIVMPTLKCVKATIEKK